MALRNLYLFGHPRVTWVFSKLRWLQYYFPKHSSSNLKFSKSDSFSDSFLHCIFDSEHFRFPFSTKNNLTWGVKWEKWNFRKSEGIYYISFENCVHEWNGHLEIFSLLQAIENSRHFCFSEQIFHRKQSLSAPENSHGSKKSPPPKGPSHRKCHANTFFFRGFICLKRRCTIRVSCLIAVFIYNILVVLHSVSKI